MSFFPTQNLPPGAGEMAPWIKCTSIRTWGQIFSTYDKYHRQQHMSATWCWGVRDRNISGSQIPSSLMKWSTPSQWQTSISNNSCRAIAENTPRQPLISNAHTYVHTAYATHTYKTNELLKPQVERWNSHHTIFT